MNTANGDPNDLRFQFKIIEQLAENGRIMAQNISKMQDTQVAMLERLARIESNTVNDTVAELKMACASQGERINKLESIEDRRVGESASKAAIIKWWPVIGTAFMVIWIIGRALGFFQIPEPPKNVTPVTVSKGI